MCVDMGKAPSTNCLHLMKEADSASERIIKVRKPYTITKQRERWTEEEHNKFLEALKLYGRAWRRIEEHVGSKTTIQIRSHAQKFFSKVTRESMGDSSGIVNAMEIPPPRPKKKPSHPYPRKLCNPSSNKDPAVGWPLLPCTPNVSNSVQETKSPTSVLSAVGSDTIRTTASNTPKTCMSPASSAGRSCMVEEIPSEQESGFKSCFESAEDMPMMEQVFSNEDTISSKDDSTKEKVSSLKLFGKIVTLTELQQQCLSDKNALEYKKSFSDIREKKSLDSYLCTDNSGGDSCSGGMLHDISSAEANMVLIPCWWSLYGRMPFPFSSPMSTTFDQSQSSHSIDGQFVDMEKTAVESFQTGCSMNDVGSSATYSKSGYVQPNNGRQKSSLQWKQSKNSAFSKLRPTSNSTRGFVPYKRCGVEKKLSVVKVACGKGGN
ncbi:hypothetical protein HPP92_005445 [Vanilla planifolia]|uniref:Uncharacterized protein n=1 Tax=Vanilla planifolia TaxID=51239 RepID=A0A835RUG1_VANPL|nr:hypothetical protein HPP92_005445 [Vanilla planifolia]